jgi:hypothetical protein
MELGYQRALRSRCGYRSFFPYRLATFAGALKSAARMGCAGATGLPPALPSKEEGTMTSMATPGRSKVVHVCAYTRFRFGALEHVIQHFRSLPRT